MAKVYSPSAPRSPLMFQKVLIANRGEIALRVIAACKDLGIPTVAVYSQADRDCLHVRHADEAICIGPAKSADSYLNIPAVISAAEIVNADAIHPGYGFLAENASFAEVCETSGITFIGPKPAVTRLMGDKAQARQAAKDAGIPVLPGSEEPLQTDEEVIACAKEVGFPVILKAAAGGGGRGMRIVRAEEDLLEKFHQAQHEASVSFSSADVYIEKFVERPRHIEFQVVGDNHGNVMVLGERECSIQRRHQKLIEEAPSPAVTPELRAKMVTILEEALARIGYSNAGTVEFVMDPDGELYFIEMNARIQVEHPVTELVTGTDLVVAQIQVAAGQKLSEIFPERPEMRGHAIECRINAENPKTFAPSAGKITAFHPPGSAGVRVDTAAYTGWFVPPYYDSLVAKLLAYGDSREHAIARMQRALDMFVVEGIYTAIPLHQQILADEQFQSGNFSTHFIEAFLKKQAESGKQ